MFGHRYRLFSCYSSTLSIIIGTLLLVIAISTKVSYAFVHLPSSMSKHQLQMSDSSNILSAGRESIEPLQINVNDTTNDNTKDVYEDNNPTKRRGRPGIVVFSGGTAFNAASAEMASRVISNNSNNSNNLDSSETGISRSNSMSSLFDLMASGSMTADINDNQNINEQQRNGGGTKVWHILPVTDDGGSTAEIVRILGGPAVGDIRSRLLRLAPGTTREARAVRRLLGHRLISTVDDDNNIDDATVSRMAREEWLDILDGGQESYQSNDNDDEQRYEHPLWKDVSTPYRSIIRAYLVHFHTQVLQRHNGIRQSQSQPTFNFRGGSIGNFFFAGARIFFGSLPAAIFLFSKVAGIPSGSRVVPAVLTEDRLVLGAELKDGKRIRGQFNISHPRPKQLKDSAQSTTPQQYENEHRQVIKKLSSEVSSLHASPIQRISYLLNDPTWRKNNQQQHVQSLDGSTIQQQQQWSSRNEITPEPNPQVLDAISNANCIVYGCGSLFTSVLPSLVLDGVGSAISSRYVYKVLLLNGWHDCETSWVETNDEDGSKQVKQMDANSIVQAVINALDQDGGSNNNEKDDEDNGSTITTDYITHIFYPIGTEIDIDEQSLLKLGIEVRGIESIPANTCSEGSRSGGQSHHVVYDTKCLVDALLSLAAV